MTRAEGTSAGVAGHTNMTGDKTRVYITVDTETSMGGAWGNTEYAPLSLDQTIFGKYRSESYGIPLIMSILEEHGFRATFFTEVFCSYNVGLEAVAAVFRCIQDRGHDAQLHLHPEQRFYREFLRGGKRREQGFMFALPASEQRQLISEGVELFRQLSGKAPRAYRAGCYAASEVTLRALRENGVEIDSSYNLAYLGSTCGFEIRPLNAPAMLEGIHEFPVSVFRVAGLGGYKPLEISAVSVREIMTAIQCLRQAGCRDVVLVLHSFSLLKNLDVRFERCRPDQFVIRRFKKLCGALAERSDELEVCVLSDAELSSIPASQPHVIPSLHWLHPGVRKIGQAVNRLPWT